MNRLTTTYLLFLLTFCFSAVNAQDTLIYDVQDEVLISGTRFEIKKNKSGRSIYKMSKKELERNSGKTISDVLSQIPGVHVDGSQAAPGTNPGYSIRGGRNKNVLILIDGQPLNDPSAITAFYDLRLIDMSQIESIEVLKGGMSSLYGSNASAGVILITTKRAIEDKISGQVNTSYGSYNTAELGLSLRGKSNKLSYSIISGYMTSDGFSEAQNPLMDSISFDDDGIKKQNNLLNIAYDINEQFKLGFTTGYDQFTTDYDNGAFVDGANIQKVKQWRVGLTPQYIYNSGKIELKTVFNANNRLFESNFPTEYNGRSLSIDLVHKHIFNNSITGLWGVNLQNMQYEELAISTFDDSQFSSYDPYASVFIDKNNLSIHAGARLNLHSEYGSGFVYNINPSYIISIGGDMSLKLFASHSTAFVAPSLYQTYSAFFGNTDLNPEKSSSVEGGISVFENEKWTFNVSYFHRNETNPIGFVSQFDDEGNFTGGNYVNLTNQIGLDGFDVAVKGFEIDINYQITNTLQLKGYYAHLSTDTPSSFYRIPANKWGVNLLVSPFDNLSLDIKYNLTGARTIFDFGSFSEIELEQYGLLDFHINYSFLDNRLQAYAAVNNLLDTDYTAIYGFNSRGRNATIGFKYNFGAK